MMILVTGATGFIGRPLVQRLRRYGHKCRVLVRKESRKKYVGYLKAQGAEIVFGDIRDPPEGLCKGITLVYHLAAKLSDENSRYHEYYKTNVLGTRKLLKMCKSRFIFLSSAGVYGPCEMAGEDTLAHPTNPYEKTKLLAEKEVESSSLPYSIIRAGLVYGPGNDRLKTLFKLAKLGLFPVIDGGKNNIQPIYIDDLINILVKVPTWKIKMLVVAGTPVSMKDFTGSNISLPGVLVSRLAAASSVFQKLTRMDLLLNKSRYAFLTQTRTFKIDELKKRYSSFTPLDKGKAVTFRSV